LIRFDPNGIQQNAQGETLSVPVHEEVETYCA